MHLFIVGDRSERERLERSSKSIGNSKIKFFGYVDEVEALSFFGACDIFVNPAHVEFYGKVYIEALSAGKPVITTDGAGAVEDSLWIDKVNSLVVPEGKNNLLEKAIISLIENNDLRRKLGENGRHAAFNKVDYNASIVSFCSEIHNLLI